MRPFLVIFKPKENPFLNPILASFEVLQYDSPPPLKKSAARILSKDKMSSFCQVLRSSPLAPRLLFFFAVASNPIH